MASPRALAVVLGLIVFGCRRPEPPPRRPAGVPAQAVWAGGVDGGAWIHCQERTSTEYACTVHDDFSGELLARGRYALHGGAGDRAARLAYSGFDGETVYLQDGRTLRPVER